MVVKLQISQEHTLHDFKFKYLEVSFQQYK